MRVLVCALFLVLLTACGGSDNGSDGGSADGGSASSDGPGAKATDGANKNGTKNGAGNNEAGSKDDDAVASEGKPAPTALSDFQCRADDDGDWSATGHLKNSSKKPVTFQITVMVRPDGNEEGKHKATTKQFDSIQPKGSVRVSMDNLRTPEDAKQCYVRVMALAS